MHSDSLKNCRCNLKCSQAQWYWWLQKSAEKVIKKLTMYSAAHTQFWVAFCEHPSSFPWLISFHIADLQFPTLSDWHVGKCWCSLWLMLWNLREFESCPAGQGKAGGSLEDVWMWPPCLQGRRITAILTNCRVTKPLTCYDREVLCLCLTQSFEMYSIALAWGWWSGPSCWLCVCLGVCVCKHVRLC